MKVVGYEQIDDIFDWSESCEDLGEDQLMEMVEAGTAVPLVQVEDFFGWDFIFRLDSGRLVLSDRNCGYPSNVSEDQLERVLELAVEQK